ncbi:MAG: hypothetical protein NC080_01950 [Paraprevotella sp.]|nr:hypothetical protein [Paraprevotella sp.]
MIRFAWQDEVLMKLLGVEIHTKNEILALFDEPEVIPNDTIMIDDGVHYAIKKTAEIRDKDPCVSVWQAKISVNTALVSKLEFRIPIDRYGNFHPQIPAILRDH